MNGKIVKKYWCQDKEIIVYHEADNTISYYYINIFGLPTLHRLDGPAIEYPEALKEWYYHGQYISVSSQEEFEQYLRLQSFW